MRKETEQIGKEILELTRSELYMRMRFLDVALGSFVYVPDEGIRLAGTDGDALFYQGMELGELFRQGSYKVNRLYLHMVLHCIFRHILFRNGRNPLLWNLAADMVTEYIIDEWNVRGVRTGQSWIRQKTYRAMQEYCRIPAVGKIYTMLEEWDEAGEDLTRLEREFTVDDHRYWPEDDDQDRKSSMNQKWKDISEKIQTDMETFSQESAAQSGHFVDYLKVENREKYDYREFLRKFSVLREEMKVDEDSFDYVFYTYGLSVYGNMPLVEPQEWKESKKVEEFVIAVDTSMSCSGELVRRFLEETYAVLCENESFFRKVNIHILQCDDRVQSDQKITSKEELKAYMDHFNLTGEGGTDFRPAFERVEEMIRNQEFYSLRGMIYFTDGQGIFPAKKPPFETAFVFMQGKETDVPSWAVKLVLDEEELQ